MRVHLAKLGDPLVDQPVETVRRLASLDRFGAHELTDDPEASDLILFPQCHMLPTDWRLTAIRDHDLTRRYSHKVMVYDERDRPWCAFPGIYVSMPARQFEHRFQRAWAYFPPAKADVPLDEPDLLFSFIGSPSSSCRRPLFDLRHPDAVVEEARGFTFYDPGSRDFEERRRRFASVLNRSRFVLCPRGRGTSSIRLYEALACRRVPVIISDDWVPPSGPNWESVSIRWPEGTSKGLAEMLEERDADWRSMAAAAGFAYREFFAPEVWFNRMVELSRDLQGSDSVGAFPRSGIRNAAFVRAGCDVARWRGLSRIRRTGKRVLRRIGLHR